MSERAVWFFELTSEWWMEPEDAAERFAVLANRMDAVHVTNARQILDAPFLERLQDGRVHAVARTDPEAAP